MSLSRRELLKAQAAAVAAAAAGMTVPAVAQPVAGGVGTPEMDYELRPDGTGGCEDPRITFVEPLRRYVMTYTVHSPNGPRIALAISEDLFRWRRLGLATFRPYEALSSKAWTTRTPASSLSQYQIHRDNSQWPSCSGHCSWHASGGNGAPSSVQPGGS